MELIVTKERLNWALGVTQSMVAKKTTMPILANVLLSVSDGELRVSASDLELTAVVKIPATVKGKGSTTVNSKVFSEIVRELPDGEVSLKLTEGERLEIVSGKSKLRINGVSAEEYPALPGMSLSTTARVSGAALAEMISKTIYAVSTDETRFNLSGVCFEMVDGENKGSKLLRGVATDGHRLAAITRSVEGLSLNASVIAPRRGLSELRRLLEAHGDKEVGLSISEGFFAAEVDNAKITMRLIDAEFPDCGQVIPKKRGKKALISTTQLVPALRRVSLMVSDRGKGVRFDLSPSTLKISSQSPELGEASEEISIQYEGESASIGFNATYLLDVATSLEGHATIVLEHQGELGPSKLYSESDESYFGIVMPMRL